MRAPATTGADVPNSAYVDDEHTRDLVALEMRGYPVEGQKVPPEDDRYVAIIRLEGGGLFI